MYLLHSEGLRFYLGSRKGREDERKGGIRSHASISNQSNVHTETLFMTDACLIASNLHGFHSNDFNKPIEQRTSDGVNQKDNILEKGWTSKEF